MGQPNVAHRAVIALNVGILLRLSRLDEGDANTVLGEPCQASCFALEVTAFGLAEQLNTRAVEIEHLKLQIAELRRMQFGRKSEKLYHQIEQVES